MKLIHHLLLIALCRAYVTVDPGPGFAYHQVQSNATTWPWQTYKSSSLTPPNLTITTNEKQLAPGLVFIEPGDFTSQPATKQSGGFAMTDQNELVFGHPVEGMTDFRVQVYNGKSYLTYWSGYSTSGANVGHGYGNVTFLDQTYETAYVVCPQLGLNTLVTPKPPCEIDIHEHQMTARNTMIVSAYNATPADLSSVNHSRNGWIYDSQFYEIDIPTNKVLFRWSAFEHIPVNTSHLPVITPAGNGTNASPWDYFHINSVELVGDVFVVNGRHTWSIYFVSASNGTVLHTLNGQTGGDFGHLPKNGTFRWQHHVRVHNVTADGSLALSMFDNHNQAIDNGTESTKGLVLGLNIPPKIANTPTVLRHLLVQAEELYADSQGSYQTDLAGSSDHQFMAYGQIPILREYGPGTNGSDLLWEAQLGAPNLVQTYRGFKQEWRAVPKWDPMLVLEKGQAFVSWNGATDVHSWLVFEGPAKNQLQYAGQVPHRGFETGFRVPTSGCVQVAALRESMSHSTRAECGMRNSSIVCH